MIITIMDCRGCLLVRQSFFHDEPRRFEDIGGGVLACRGFHSSFRATQAGLSLNMGKLLDLGLEFQKRMTRKMALLWN